MNYKIKQPKRILAVDPGTRYLGVAIMEDDEPIYYAVKTIKINQVDSKRLDEAKTIIQKLIDIYRPEILVIEKPKPHWSKQSELLNKIIKAIQDVAKNNKMGIKKFSPKEIRKIICGNAKATKNEMLDVLLQQYPKLQIILKSRQIKDRYWNHLFDAMILGLLVKISNQ